MLPPIAVVFPIFLAYAFFGPGSYPGLILLYTAFALPYAVWMMRGYLQDVPVELEEAALVDGRSHLSVLWNVTVPVARNQIEAMTLADRIVLPRDGRLEQEGRPPEFFGRPASAFVAAFLGSPKMNFILAVADGGKASVEGGNSVSLPKAVKAGGPVLLGLRPRHIYRAGKGQAGMNVKVDLVQVAGRRVIVTFRPGWSSVIASLEAGGPLNPGGDLTLGIDTARLQVFDPKTELRIG